MAGEASTRKYDLRPATASDAAFIYLVRRSGLRPYVEQLWGWNETYQRVRFCEAFDPERYQVIVVDGKDVGAVSVEQRPTEMYLSDIEIVPERRGRGLGTAILSEIVLQGHSRGLPVALQVLRANPARRLYERIGFRVVGETVTHVLMRTDVPPGHG